MEKKNIIRLIIQIAIGLIIAVGVMTSQGAFAEGVSVADRILAIGNGFSVIALLYISFGLLVWISTTGVLDIFSFALQKGAHFLIYAALGMCMFQFFKTWNCSFGRTVIFTLAVCFCYACSDEFHQLFISGRSGQWSDVWLDTAGAGTAVLLTRLFTICRNREKTG